MVNNLIFEMAYNAAFGGVRCEEFYILTIPVVITIIITGCMFFRSVKRGDRIYTIGDAFSAVFSIGFVLFLIDAIITYSMDPQENGVIFNILAFIILGFVLFISYMVLAFIPFCIMAFLLIISHDIAFCKHYSAKKVQDIVRSDMTDEEKIDLIVNEIGVNNAHIIRQFLKQLLKCDSWRDCNYNGVTYYSILVNTFFKEPTKLYIEMPFDDDMLQVVRNGCKNFDYFGFECVKKEYINWVLQYTAYFKTREERDVALNDIKTIISMLGLSHRFSFPK